MHWTPENVKSALSRFKRAADEFTALRKKLHSRTPTEREKWPIPLQNKYAATLQKAAAIQQAVTGVRDKVESSVRWARDVTGLSNSELQQVPLVVAGYVAAVVGVTWVVGNSLNEMRALDREVEALKTGKPLALSGMNLFGARGSLVWPAVILVAGYFLLPYLED